MKIQKLLSVPLSVLITATPIGLIFAQEESEPPRRLEELLTIFDKVAQYVIPFAALVCVVFIIVGGYMWIVAAGDPSRVKQAQGTLTWAIIGLVLVLLAVTIVEVLKKVVGL
ncbi:MAG: pilin [Candidatus Dojkabacteria bacterium]|nr:pilin [Candidatus Dojkabacteria bacterium]